jgi:hypothetical protein
VRRGMGAGTSGVGRGPGEGGSAARADRCRFSVLCTPSRWWPRFGLPADGLLRQLDASQQILKARVTTQRVVARIYPQGGEIIGDRNPVMLTCYRQLGTGVAS